MKKKLILGGVGGVLLAIGCLYALGFEAPRSPTTSHSGNGSGPADARWAAEPMRDLTVVTLNAEEGGVSQLLERFVPQIRETLNIDLRIVSVPFAKKFAIQRDDLSKPIGAYDLYVTWPTYLADFAPHLEPLENVAPGGIAQVEADLQLADVHPSYQWCVRRSGRVYGTQIDGDVKLLTYRRDLADDPQEKAGFKARYGYDLDVNRLTWSKYRDVAEFFTRPDENFYGTAELATFLSYFYFMDRFSSMGGHLFSYEDMRPFPNRELALAALEHGIDTFDKVSPPEAREFVVEDLFQQLWVEERVFMTTFWPDAWRLGNDPKTSKIPGKIGVAQMPGFERDGALVFRPDMNGGRIVVLGAHSKVKEAAYKVLAFLSDEDRTRHMVSNRVSWLDPWRKSHLDPELFADIVPDQPALRQSYVDVIQESTSNGYPGLQIPGTGEYHDVVEHWVIEAWQGRVSADKALEQMVESLDEITKKRGRDIQLTEWRTYVDEVLKPRGLYP